MEDNWLKWSKRLKAISQIGIAYTKNPYDIERYSQIEEIAIEMLSTSSGIKENEIKELFIHDSGYATPKVDLRAAAFKEDKILMVKERSDGGWTLPGGWADVNESPREGIIREVYEESGFKIEPQKLAAIIDRSKHPYMPQYPYHLYKIFFICKIVGGSHKESIETSEIDFFARYNIPKLSIARVLPKQIDLMFEHYYNMSLPTIYD